MLWSISPALRHQTLILRSASKRRVSKDAGLGVAASASASPFETALRASSG